MNIDNKIRADLFRNRIEDKNQLTGAGAIYVGTGIPKYIDSAGAMTGTPSTGTIGPFYETTSITPTTGGQVPVSVMGTGSAEATGTVAGLKFKSVNDAMKDVDGNIVLDAKGFNLTTTGTTYIKSNTCDITGSLFNVWADKINLITSNVAFKNDTTGTELRNVREVIFTKSPYTAPSGTLDRPGGTPYTEDIVMTGLTPIISNIDARLNNFSNLDWLGGEARSITLSNPGLYLFRGEHSNFGVIWWNKALTFSSTSYDSTGQKLFMLRIDENGKLVVCYMNANTLSPWEYDDQAFVVYYKIIK